MDAFHAALAAQMLGELGITIGTAELATPDLPTPPPSPTLTHHQGEQWSPPKQLASYTHMTHLQQDRPRIPYTRLTHFVAHLTQLTGRIGLEGLPKGLIRRLRRSGVKPTEDTAYFRIRRLLRKWGYSSPEYRKIFAILKAMGGPVPTIPYGVENQMRQDFIKLAELFDQRQPLGSVRKNMMSYYLVIQLLLQKHRIKCFYKLPSIKGIDKFNSLVKVYCDLTTSNIQPPE
jgi:hypothetical protein